jgi:hypothetical protein
LYALIIQNAKTRRITRRISTGINRGLTDLKLPKNGVYWSGHF